MPSPFPGMDPYLEDPGLWPNVHGTLINVTRQLLSEALRPRYFVGIEERVYVSAEDDPGREVIVPDLYIKPLRDIRAGGASGGAAVAEPIEVTLLDPEIHERRIEIIDHQSHAVVAVIEYLSPANKVQNSHGRESFLEKRTKVYESGAHWIEIDLLRAGLSTFNRWAGTASDYGVHLSRRLDQHRRQSLLWLIALAQQLPTIPVPLKAGDEDGALDLQQVIAQTYQQGNYDLILNYELEPRVPLSDADWRWSRGIAKRV